MTALIMKDITSLKKTLPLTVLLCIAIAGYGIHREAWMMVPLICAMVPLILTAIAFGYDHKANFEQFAFSLPIKRKSYVLSKLFFALAFGVVGALCMLVFLTVKGSMPLGQRVFAAAMTLIASILVSAVQLPFILKYGAEKGRLIMVITYFAIFGLSTLLKEKGDFLATLMERYRDRVATVLSLGIIALSIAIIAAAITSAIVLMEKKEY